MLVVLVILCSVCFVDCVGFFSVIFVNGNYSIKKIYIA